MKVAYVVSRFPHLSETFILREMDAMEAQGWEIELFALIEQRQPVVHDAARRWLPRVERLSATSTAAVVANLRAFVLGPVRYVRAFVAVMWMNRSSVNFLARAAVVFPKAVHASHLVTRHGIEHVHAHYATHPALVAWVVRRLTGTTFTVTVHAHDLFVRQTALAEKLRDADAVVAVSEYNRRLLVHVLGDGACSKVRVIHCGIDPDRYRPPPTRPAPGDRFEVVSIGSLQEYKGHRHLVQACAELRQRGVPVHCQVVGEGPERARLERAIRRLDLGADVELLGALPEDAVAPLLARAHCYAQPSIVASTGQMEGIPVALMEALATGLPVVATELSGVPELVRHGRTGLLVAPGNSDALADALAEIYRSYPQVALMGLAGRAVVEDEFDVHRNAASLGAVIARVVEHGDPPAG